MNGKSFTKLFRALGVLLLVSVVCLPASVHAGVPKLINFEGKLTEIDGTPISGKRTITFRIYESADTGLPKWLETREATIDNGFYSILLGSVEPFDPQMKFDNAYWLSVQVSDEAEMSPRYQIGAAPYAINADMVDGKDSMEIIPSGVIVMWSGTIAEIPAGWHLCDGDERTPDLRDKFILGVSAEKEPGGTGGAHSRTLSITNLPSHTHGSAGAHTHNIVTYSNPAETGDSIATATKVGSGGIATSKSSGAHTHSSVGSGTPFDNRPAFYKLAYIMKL